MKTKAKKRNKQDATLININALKRRVNILEKFIHEIHDRYAFIVREVLTEVGKDKKK